MQLTQTSLLAIFGDSLAGRLDQAIDTFMIWNGTLLYVDSYYKRRSTGFTGFQTPKWVNFATNGNGSTNCAGLIAGQLATQAFTHAFIAGFINDPTLGINKTTSLANWATIIAACAARNVKLFVAGPIVNGELWPPPLNVDDVAIDALNSGTPPNQNTLISGSPNCEFIDMRDALYFPSGVEPIFNAPSPGIANGPLTRPDTVPRKHTNMFGASRFTLAVRGRLVLT